MTNTISTSINQPATTTRASDRQTTLWREWRHCNDEPYAEHLYNLLTDQPTNRLAALVMILLGAILGALGGGLVTLLLYPTGENASAVLAGAGTGLAAGGVVGLLVIIGLKATNRAVWHVWLRGVIPNKPFLNQTRGQSLNSLFFVVVIGLSSTLGAGITGALFFEQVNAQFFGVLLALVLTGVIAFFIGRRATIIDVVIGTPAGLTFGLLFGLGCAQILGIVAGSLDVTNSIRIVGLATGLGIGILLGRWSGLAGTLAGVSVVTPLILLAGINLVLLGWLVGLLFGGIVGSLSQMWEPLNRRLSFVEAYRYRWLCLWWFRRPPATVVEAALRLQPGWKKLLLALDSKRKSPAEPKRLITDLIDRNWRERFIARHALVNLGSKALPELSSGLFRAGENRASHEEMLWLINSISVETTTRLAHQTEQLICPTCLTKCGAHEIETTRWSYYGCRTCGRSRNLLHCPEGIVAVLDAAMPEAQHYRDGLLSLNWLARRELFDFDRVEITDATDEDVERFAVQVGNDTDAVRQARYGQMVCHINGTQSRLSENTLRILQRTFGQVSHK